MERPVCQAKDPTLVKARKAIPVFIHTGVFTRLEYYCVHIPMNKLPDNCIDNYMEILYKWSMEFEWSGTKNHINIEKHGVSFYDAQYAFADPKRVILEDVAHSSDEKRYFCIGKTIEGIITVRFVYRGQKIRIFGAGYWRKGKKLYEKTD